MFGFGKKKKGIETEVETPNIDAEMSLIILTERKLPNLRAFMADQGLNITEVYTDIEEAKIGLLMQSCGCRVAIIETGLGKFTTTAMRIELSDLLGMCDGIEKKVVAFYTDSLIKTDNTKGKKSNAEWVQYQSTVEVANKLLEYKEKYTVNETVQPEKIESAETLLKIQGLFVGIKENMDLRPNMVEVDVQDLVCGDKESELLPNFEPAY